MSSSNIIKPDTANERGFEKFVFEVIHQEDVSKQAGQPAASFVPFLKGLSPASVPTAQQEAQVAPLVESQDHADSDAAETMVLVGIPEEVHFRQVQESYEKGFEEGKRQAERGLANVFKALRDAVEELSSLREQVIRESEEDLLKLAVMIARKVIHQEIAIDRLILAKIVAAAVSGASERDEVVIRLNPEDYRLVSAHKHLYLGGCADERLVEIKADDAIAPGGCIVDTATGEIDARPDAQIDEIFRRLLEEKCTFTDLSSDLTAEREHHAYEEN